MGTVYTSGTWVAKAGREDEFIAAWQELAEWTTSEVPGAVWATLLRNLDDPRRFVSFGPWDSMEAVAAWRAMPEFAERVAGIRDLLESFEPAAFEAVVEVS